MVCSVDPNPTTAAPPRGGHGRVGPEGSVTSHVACKRFISPEIHVENKTKAFSLATECFCPASIWLHKQRPVPHGFTQCKQKVEQFANFWRCDKLFQLNASLFVQNLVRKIRS